MHAKIIILCFNLIGYYVFAFNVDDLVWISNLPTQTNGTFIWLNDRVKEMNNSFGQIFQCPCKNKTFYNKRYCVQSIYDHSMQLRLKPEHITKRNPPRLIIDSMVTQKQDEKMQKSFEKYLIREFEKNQAILYSSDKATQIDQCYKIAMNQIFNSNPFNGFSFLIQIIEKCTHGNAINFKTFKSKMDISKHGKKWETVLNGTANFDQSAVKSPSFGIAAALFDNYKDSFVKKFCEIIMDECQTKIEKKLLKHSVFIRKYAKSIGRQPTFKFKMSLFHNFMVYDHFYYRIKNGISKDIHIMATDVNFHQEMLQKLLLDLVDGGDYMVNQLLVYKFYNSDWARTITQRSLWLHRIKVCWLAAIFCVVFFLSHYRSSYPLIVGSVAGLLSTGYFIYSCTVESVDKVLFEFAN